MLTSKELLTRLEELHPKKIDLSLGRVETLCERLGNPQNKLPPVIHVAGTNGKGSVIAFIESILKAAGKTVHVFTSPHLVRFHERIRLNLQDGTTGEIGEQDLIDILTRTEEANADAPITFFEITTVAAFLAFSEHPADYLLLETGLGGRLDATNVVQSPLLAVLTSISIDHTSFLGDTITQIAREKAGILKPGTPGIVAPTPDEAFDQIENRAEEIGAPLHAANRQWQCFEQHHRLVFQDEEALFDLSLPNLFGRHQIDNAGTAIAAVRAIPDLELSAEILDEGITTARWPGRMERLKPGPFHSFAADNSEIWIDGGHNPAAARALAETMAELEDKMPRPLHVICGMINNKDALSFFEMFKDLTEYVVTVTIPEQENSYTAEELAALAHQAGLKAHPASSIEAALADSKKYASEPARILICGSLYLLGTILAKVEEQPAAQ